MNFLTKAMGRTLLVLFALAFVFMLFQPFSDVGFVEPFSVIIIAIALYFGLSWLYRKLSESSQSRLKILILSLFAFFILLQIVIVNASHAGAFGDPWHIQAQASRLMAGEKTWDIWIQMYPNLVPMVGLDMLFIRLSEFLHISYYAIFFTFNIFINSALWAIVLRFIWWKKAAVAVFMMIVLLSMAPMYGFLINVAYSDGIAMLALAVLVWLVERLLERGSFSPLMFLATAISFAFAYLTRPNAVVVIIALGILALLAWHKKVSGLAKPLLLMIAATIVGIMLALLASRGIAHLLGYDLNNPYVFPVWNWIYEGLNLHSGGEWTPTDRDYTLFHSGFATAKEADISGIVQRLKDYNILILPLFLVKFGTLWSTGTFATGTDYTLFSGTFNWTHAPGWLVQNIGAFNIAWTTYSKALVALLLLAIVLRLWKNRESLMSSFGFLLLTIMGISLFHSLLWEVKPRYQFMTFALLFIAAALSLDELFVKRTVSDKWQSRLKIALPVMSVISLILMATLMQLQPKQQVVVTAQQHPSDNYGYSRENLWLEPNETIYQAFKLPVAANQIDWQTGTTAPLDLTVEQEVAGNWKEVVQLRLPEMNRPAAEISEKFISEMPAGNYRFAIRNPGSKPASVQALLNTRALDYPYLIEGKNASLAFIISQTQKVSKFPLGMIIGFAVLYLLINLAYWHFTKGKNDKILA